MAAETLTSDGIGAPRARPGTSGPGHSRRHGWFLGLSWSGRTGAVLFALLALLGAISTLLPIGDPVAIGAGPSLVAPSWHYLMGTDEFGRLELARCLVALRNTLILTCLSVGTMVLIGCPLAVFAGLVRGWADAIIIRSVDAIATFPAILLALLLAAIIGTGGGASYIAIVVFTMPLMVRVVRAATLELADREFIISARVSGSGWPRIMLRHVLRNISGVIAVQFTYAFSVALVIESALDFLGVGVQPPTPTLGALIHDGVEYMVIAPWLVVFPALLLAMIVFSLTLVGDALSDRSNPVLARRLA